MGAEQAKVGWGDWGVGNAAVTGDWVGGKVGKENTDKLTGKTTPCHPETDSGPRPPVPGGSQLAFSS